MIMRVVAPPPNVPGETQSRDDDLEALLRSFFRAEMPDPWPSLEAPASRLPFRPVRRPERPALWRSRLALAASVALLVLGSLFLLGKQQAPETNLGSKAPAIGSNEERNSLDHYPTQGPKRNKEIQSEGLKLMPDGNAVYEIKVGPAPPSK